MTLRVAKKVVRQRAQNHERRDDEHITLEYRQPRHIVRGAITATPTTHPDGLVMAMLSFCKQRDKAVLGGKSRPWPQ